MQWSNTALPHGRRSKEGKRDFGKERNARGGGGEGKSRPWYLIQLVEINIMADLSVIIWEYVVSEV